MPFPQIELPLLLTIAGVGGLVVGSFLNVVIHRLPIMIERELSDAVQEQLAPEGAPDRPQARERFDLWWPPSSCPACHRRIAAWDNLPVIGYLRLRGRCASCRATISPRYPLVEALTAALFLIVAWRLGASWATPLGWLFAALLIAQSAIDLDHKLLPDELVYLLLWSGLLASLLGPFTTPGAAIIGAAAGYGALYLLRLLWLQAFGREAIGLGDAKLVAALGAWFGWQALPTLLLLAALLGIAVTLAQRLARGRGGTQEIAFGPYLAVAGGLQLLFGAEMAQVSVLLIRL